MDAVTTGSNKGCLKHKAMNATTFAKPSPFPAIVADGLTLGYPGKPIIEHFTATIEMGQFVGIFGPNGSGKTTFLRSLLGLIKPLNGKLMVLGQVPRSGHAQIGYMPQWMQATNVGVSGSALLAATIRGNRWGLPFQSRRERKAMERVIELVGAQHYAHRPFSQLSGGERQRLLLAQALLGEPQILLLDEPLANLDPHYQKSLISLIENIRQQLGITVLLTAHDINPLLGFMTKVLYLARGRAVIGTVNQVITSETLSALYDSPIEVIHYQDRILVIHKSTGQPENVVCH